MSASTVLANPYSGEHIARKTLADQLAEQGFAIQVYGLTDKEGVRTLAAKAGVRTPKANEPPVENHVHTAVRAALAEHGYELVELSLQVKATRDVTGQQTLNFRIEPGQHPDNVRDADGGDGDGDGEPGPRRGGRPDF